MNWNPTNIKRLLFYYIGLMVISPLSLLLFDFFQMSIRKTKYRQKYGEINEEMFIDGVGVMYMCAGTLLLILIPFITWTFILRKKINEPITTMQKIQFYILTAFPISLLLLIDIGLIVLLIKMCVD